MADLFTLEELVAYMQVDEFDAFTATLARELATAKLRAAAGPVRYDALTDLSLLKPIALDLAKRIVTNPSGLRSASIDDYSETFASETLGSDLSRAEVAEVRRLTGRPSAFTIAPAMPARSPACAERLYL